ncbi:hypothetical protein HAX54_011103 [Datura stramonium]|uniref:Uncharacterized protein n=1 Tax=Datura stramonium TaxID=4076 RepID=A0ABS8TIV0_DATST|nr:hypothetical protein [Datura stramonium]
MGREDTCENNLQLQAVEEKEKEEINNAVVVGQEYRDSNKEILSVTPLSIDESKRDLDCSEKGLEITLTPAENSEEGKRVTEKEEDQNRSTTKGKLRNSPINKLHEIVTHNTKLVGVSEQYKEKGEMEKTKVLEVKEQKRGKKPACPQLFTGVTTRREASRQSSQY